MNVSQIDYVCLIYYGNCIFFSGDIPENMSFPFYSNNCNKVNKYQTDVTPRPEPEMSFTRLLTGEDTYPITENNLVPSILNNRETNKPDWNHFNNNVYNEKFPNTITNVKCEYSKHKTKLTCTLAPIWKPKHLTSTKKNENHHPIMRSGATDRERNRMHTLNEAFEELRKVVPKSNLSEHQRLSKIATLRLAIHYISALDAVLKQSG